MTRYAHCSSVLVTAGDEVRQGDLIGLVGRTGNASGNHCHFEVRLNGERQNPMNYPALSQFILLLLKRKRIKETLFGKTMFCPLSFGAVYGAADRSPKYFLWYPTRTEKSRRLRRLEYPPRSFLLSPAAGPLPPL